MNYFINQPEPMVREELVKDAVSLMRDMNSAEIFAVFQQLLSKD